MSIVQRSGENVIRSFSVDRAFDQELTGEAGKQSRSVSNLIEYIIEDYLNHKRWIDSLGNLIIRRDTMEVFLEFLSEEDMRLIGAKIGESIPQRAFIMRGMDFDEEAMLFYIEKMLGEWDNWFDVTYHEREKPPYLYIMNQLGSKWAAFIEAHIKAMYQGIGKEVSCVRVGDNLHVIFE